MAHHVQINPTAPALHVSRDLLEVLEQNAVDFEIRYCFIPEENAEATIEALEALTPQGVDEAFAVKQLIADLIAGEPVEVLYS
jgi:hypothetical protein